MFLNSNDWYKKNFQETDATRRKLRSIYNHRVEYQNMRKALSPLINFKAVLVILSDFVLSTFKF